MTYEDLGGRAAPRLSRSVLGRGRRLQQRDKCAAPRARPAAKRCFVPERRVRRRVQRNKNASNLDRCYTGFGTVPATFSTPLLTEVRLLE